MNLIGGGKRNLKKLGNTKVTVAKKKKLTDPSESDSSQM